MATMSISVTESMKAFLEEQTRREGYGTVSEYLRAVIRDLQKRNAKKAVLDAQLLEGQRSPTVRMTSKRWDKLEQKVKESSPELG